MQLHFEAGGDGEPLIILHGLFGSLDNWRPMSKRLADHFKVFALDQRNHGQSPHSFEMDYARMAADVQEFITAQGLKDALVLGHSMGAKTAMQLALRHPDSVRELVVVDMAPRRDPGRHTRLIAGMRSLDLSRFQNRKEIEAALEPAVGDLPTRQFLLKNLARQDNGGFCWKIGLEEIYQNYQNLTEAIESTEPYTKAALFIRGEKSDYLRKEDQPDILRLFPKAEFRTVPGAGHLPHVETPETFYDCVTAFLR